MNEASKSAHSSQDIELIIGNSNSNFSGVTSTMLQVLSNQQALINLRVMGPHHLPDPAVNISFLEVAKLCRKPLANGKYRIFHARRVDEMIQALILKYIFRAKIKVVFSSAAQRYRSGLTLWLTGKMDAVLAMCNASASFLSVKPNKVIYHGIKSELYLPAEDKEQLWQSLGYGGKYGIAILGRVRKQKGVHLFVEACLSVLKKHPDFTAIVVGAISSSEKEFVESLKVKIIAENMQDRVIFTGEQKFEDIPKIFSALSVVAALSDNEGFGLTIPEAMSSGAAVLATEAGAWPEVIRNGIDGYVVPIKNQQAVTDKLDQLLSSPEQLEQMGKAGRARVLEHYTVAREAKELVDSAPKAVGTAFTEDAEPKFKPPEGTAVPKETFLLHVIATSQPFFH